MLRRKQRSASVHAVVPKPMPTSEPPSTSTSRRNSIVDMLHQRRMSLRRTSSIQSSTSSSSGEEPEPESSFTGKALQRALPGKILTEALRHSMPHYQASSQPEFPPDIVLQECGSARRTALESAARSMPKTAELDAFTVSLYAFTLRHMTPDVYVAHNYVRALARRARPLKKDTVLGFRIPAYVEETDVPASVRVAMTTQAPLVKAILGDFAPVYEAQRLMFASKEEAAVYFDLTLRPHLPMCGAYVGATDRAKHVDGDFVAHCFYGLGAYYMVAIAPGADAEPPSWPKREASTTCVPPAGAVAVVDLSAISRHPVRDEEHFVRYGAAAFFDVARQPLGIWLEADLQMMRPGDPDWEWAVWRFKCTLICAPRRARRARATARSRAGRGQARRRLARSPSAPPPHPLPPPPLRAPACALRADQSFTLEHLVRCHWIVSNTLTIALREGLHGCHPIRLLMRPHTFASITINQAAVVKLASRHTGTFRIGAHTQEAIEAGIGEMTDKFEYRTFHEHLAAKGAFPAEFGFERLPYAQDGRALWDATATFHKRYVQHFYPSEAVLRGDAQLVRFWELADTGAMERRRFGLPAELTRSNLCDFLTFCAFEATAVHELLGARARARAAASRARSRAHGVLACARASVRAWAGSQLLDVSLPTTFNGRIHARSYFRQPDGSERFQCSVQDWYRIAMATAATTTLPVPHLIPEMRHFARLWEDRKHPLPGHSPSYVVSALYKDYAHALQRLAETIDEENRTLATRSSAFGAFNPRVLETSVSL